MLPVDNVIVHTNIEYQQQSADESLVFHFIITFSRRNNQFIL